MGVWGIITGRSVNCEFAHPAGRLGTISVLRHHAVRHLLKVRPLRGAGTCKLLVRGARMGLMAGLPRSIIVRPSTWKLYSHTPGATGPWVTLQTSFVPLGIVARPLNH